MAYARGCTCIGWHLKERFLRGTITWSQMAKQSIQARKVYRVLSLTWPASMQIYCNKRKRLHKKRVQLPGDWFGTPTWPPWRHVKTLYCFCPFSFRLHRSLALSSIAIFVVKRLLTMWAPITSASFLSWIVKRAIRASSLESRPPSGEFSVFPTGAPFLIPIWGQLIYNIEYFKCRPNEAIVLFYNFLLQSRTQCYSIYTKLN